MRRWFFVVLLAITSLSAAEAKSLYAPEDLALAKKAMVASRKSDLAYDLVKSLVTEVGPRPAGSPGDAAAVKWAKAKLEGMGFDKVWTEPVPLSKVWTRGTAQGEIISPARQKIPILALGNSISTESGGITSQLALYENYEELKNDTSDRAKGRIVFVDYKTNRTKDGSGYGKASPGRFRGASEAAKRGAVGIIIRSLGTDRTGLHTGAMRYEEGVPKIPAVAVSNQGADTLRKLLNKKVSVTFKLEMQNTTVLGGTSYNVLAEITGSEKPEQIVAMGAHLDSWDVGKGAVDDGAGVAITVSALKILRDLSVSEKLKPKRTIRVVLFANEENSVEGAREYAKVHAKEKHQIVSESDFGAGEVYGVRGHVDSAALEWLKEIAAVLKPIGVKFSGNDGQTGADLHIIAEEQGFAQVALEQNGMKYFDWHHSAADTLDKIKPGDLQQNVAAWSVMAWLSAQAGVDFKAK